MDINKLCKSYIIQVILLFTGRIVLVIIALMVISSGLDRSPDAHSQRTCFRVIDRHRHSSYLAMGCFESQGFTAYLFHSCVRFPVVVGIGRDVCLLLDGLTRLDASVLPGIHGLLCSIIGTSYLFLRQSV